MLPQPTTPRSSPKATTTRLPQSTPVVYKSSSYIPHQSSASPEAQGQRVALVNETVFQHVGAKPVDEFLKEFLPCVIDLGEPSKEVRGAFSLVAFCQTEPQMYEPFVKAANRLMANFKLVVTSTRGDPNCEDLQPDVTMYEKGSATIRADFSEAQLWIEFKLDANDDAYKDPEKGQEEGHEFESDTEDGISTRGQLLSYAAAHLGTQFRTHAFSILVCGKFARFSRWDRAGVTVSARFNYVEQFAFLPQFFQRLDRLSENARGVDTTLRPVQTSEADPPPGYPPIIRLEPAENSGLREIMVPAARGSPSRYFHIPYPPPFTIRSPFGRATRTCSAKRATEQKFLVFVKDGWRASKMQKESEIYLKLQGAGVTHIAPFECGGDISGLFHETITHQEAKKSWVCSPNKLRVEHYYHHRLALGVVGRDLIQFSSTKELTKAILDGLKAHRSALKSAYVLHRDLSAGNFIIVEGGGILIDWDHCNDVGQAGTPRRPGRTGTWQFISCRLLQDPNSIQTAEDDRESAFWVLLYCALRFSESDLSPRARSNLLARFDESTATETGHVGGERKLFLLSKPFTFKFTSSPMNDLLEELRDVFAAAYEPEPSDDDKALASEIAAVNQARAQRLSAYRWIEAAKQREDPNWLVEVLEKHLAFPGWPEGDQGTLQDHLSPSANLNPRKRTSEQAALDANAVRYSKARTAPLGV